MKRQSHEARAEEAREQAAEYEAHADALKALRDEVVEGDSIGETRLAELFHEVRTSSPRSWDSATAFIDINDGEAVVDHVSRLREGSWSPETRDRFDALVSISIDPFQSTKEFKQVARFNLNQKIDGAQQNAASARRRAKDAERLAER